MFDSQSNFLQSLGWALLSSLWQMAILWVIYQVATLLLPARKPAVRSHLATALVLSGFGWFLYTLFFSPVAEAAEGGPFGSLLAVLPSASPVDSWLHRILPALAAAYLLFLLIPVAGFVRNYRFVRTIRTKQLEKAPVEWRIFVKNVAALMGIRKNVKLWVSALVTSPVTVGFLKPVILLPASAIAQLTPVQLEAVLLHELAHIRRFDYFFNLLIRFIQTLLYFNPFIRSLVKAIECEREKSCDEMVMQFQYDPHGYASALLTLERAQLAFKPLALAAAGRKNDLLNRIEWMLGVRKKTFTVNRLASLVAGLVCLVLVYSLLMAGSPLIGSKADAVMSDVTSPVSFFGENDSRPAQTLTVATHPRKTIQGSASSAASRAAQPAPSPMEWSQPTPVNLSSGPLAFASLGQTMSLQLKKYQEEQVKNVVNASRRLIAEKQWKNMEIQLADAVTESEKEQLKEQYEEKLARADWDKMQEKLRSSYEQIDWNQLNANLGQAMQELRLDSLQQVYFKAIRSLDQLEKQLKESDLTGIPDTGVSLQSLQENKVQLQRAVIELKKARTKKTVRL